MWAAFASVNLICNDLELKGLCPSDNEPRMCTCVVTSGNTLRWLTSQPGCCFTAPSVSRSLSFSSANKTGNSAEHTCIMGITAELTNNTEGHLTSILIFTPSAVSTTGLTVTCENPNTGEDEGKKLTVTYSGVVHSGNTGNTCTGGRAWADFLTKLNNYNNYIRTEWSSVMGFVLMPGVL